MLVRTLLWLGWLHAQVASPAPAARPDAAASGASYALVPVAGAASVSARLAKFGKDYAIRLAAGFPKTIAGAPGPLAVLGSCADADAAHGIADILHLDGIETRVETVAQPAVGCPTIVPQSAKVVANVEIATAEADQARPARGYRIFKKTDIHDQQYLTIALELRHQVITDLFIDAPYEEICDEHENPGPRRVCGYDRTTPFFAGPVRVGSKTWLLVKTVETSHRQNPDGAPVRKDRVQARFSLWGYACGTVREVLDPTTTLGKSGRPLSFTPDGSGVDAWRSVVVEHKKKRGATDPVARFVWSDDACQYQEQPDAPASGG